MKLTLKFFYISSVTRLATHRHNSYSPDISMSNSYHGSIMSNSMTTSQIESHNNNPLEMTKSLIENFTGDIMSQSMDTSSLNASLNSTNNSGSSVATTTTLNGTQSKVEITPPKCLPVFNDSLNISSGPLPTVQKMMPVPESLMSPDCQPTTYIGKIIPASTPPQIPKAMKTKETVGKTNVKSGVSNTTKQSLSNTKIMTVKMRNERGTGSPKRSGSASTGHSSVNTTPRSSVSSVPSSIQTSKSVSQTTQNQSIPVRAATPASSERILSSEDEGDSFTQEKIKAVRHKAAEKCQKQKKNAEMCLTNVSKTTENSAIMIQKLWRGYRTRKQHHLAEKIQRKKTENYIRKLTKDMEDTKAALENERKIQQLQMQAINALWKKVSSLQQQQQQITSATTTPVVQNIFEETLKSTTLSLNFDNQSVNVVQDLTKTCSMLMTQVAQLQNSMQSMVNCMTMFAAYQPPQQSHLEKETASDTIETQTEIIAVHTPQVESFPFHSNQNTSNSVTATHNNKLLRPNSLHITSSTETSPKNLRFNSVQISKSNSADEEGKKDDPQAIETLVNNTSEMSVGADDTNNIDNEPISELESEKHENEVVTEMEKEENEETIADASSICTEN